MTTLQTAIAVVLGISLPAAVNEGEERVRAFYESQAAQAVTAGPMASRSVWASAATAAGDAGDAGDKVYAQAPATRAPETVQTAPAGEESVVSMEVLPGPDTPAPVAPSAPQVPQPPAQPVASQPEAPADQGSGEATVTLIDPYAPAPGGAAMLPPPETGPAGQPPVVSGGQAQEGAIQIIEQPQPDAQANLAPDGQPAPPAGQQMPPPQQPFEQAAVVVVEQAQPVMIVPPETTTVVLAQPYVYYPPPVWASTCYVSYGPGWSAYQVYPAVDPYYYGDPYVYDDWTSDFYLGLAPVGYSYYGRPWRGHWGGYVGLGYGAYCGPSRYFGVGFAVGYGGSYVSAYGSYGYGYGYGWGTGWGRSWGRGWGHGWDHRPGRHDIVRHSFGRPWESHGGSHSFAHAGGLPRNTVAGRIVGAQNDRIARYSTGTPAGRSALPTTPRTAGAPSRMSAASPAGAPLVSAAAPSRRSTTPTVRQAGSADAGEPTGRMIDTRRVSSSHAGATAAGAASPAAAVRPTELTGSSDGAAASLDSLARKRQAYREMTRTRGTSETAAPAVAGTARTAAGSPTAGGTTTPRVPSRTFAPAKPGAAGGTDSRTDLYRRLTEAQARTPGAATPTAPRTGTASPSSPTGGTTGGRTFQPLTPQGTPARSAPTPAPARPVERATPSSMAPAPTAPLAPRTIERTTVGPMTPYRTIERTTVAPAPSRTIERTTVSPTTPYRSIERETPSPAAQPPMRRTMSSGTINYVPGRDVQPSPAPTMDRSATVVRPSSRSMSEAPRAVAAPAAPAPTFRMEPRSFSRGSSASDAPSVRTSPSGPTRTLAPADRTSDYRPSSRSYGRSDSSDSDRSGSTGGSRSRR